MNIQIYENIVFEQTYVLLFAETLDMALCYEKHLHPLIILLISYQLLPKTNQITWIIAKKSL